MTPKEKAKSLIDKFKCAHFHLDSKGMDCLLAKRCAEILIDECINITNFDSLLDYECDSKYTIEYWQAVKDELKKL